MITWHECNATELKRRLKQTITTSDDFVHFTLNWEKKIYSFVKSVRFLFYIWIVNLLEINNGKYLYNSICFKIQISLSQCLKIKICLWKESNFSFHGFLQWHTCLRLLFLWFYENNHLYVNILLLIAIMLGVYLSVLGLFYLFIYLIFSTRTFIFGVNHLLFWGWVCEFYRKKVDLPFFVW